MKAKEWKRCMVVILAATVTAGLTACGNSDSTAVSKSSATPETESKIATTEVTGSANVAESTDNTSSDEEVTIKFANFSASGGNEENLNKMYEEFEKVYPNIHVDIETIGFDDYFTQMQTRVAGGTAPDCYELNIENFASYSAKGVLAEVKDIDASKFNESALSAFKTDNIQYGLPASFSNVVLVYNKDLFDKAGVEYPTDDWTWDDVDKAAEKIRKLGDDIYGICQPVTYNEFYKVATQYGGGVMNADKTEYTLDTPENEKALSGMVDRIIKTNTAPTTEQMGGLGDWDLFESGRLGMIPTGIWAFSTFKDACTFKWDICVEPGEKQKATHFFSNALVINSSSDAGKQAAATKWINFMASDPVAAKIRIEAGWDLPAISDQNVLNDYLKLTPPDNRKAVFDSLQYLVVPPVVENYSEMSDIINVKLEEASSGKISVKEALKQAQEECTSKVPLTK